MTYLKSISKGFGATVNHLNEIVEAHNQVSLQSVRINLKEYIEQAIGILRIQIKETDAVIRNHVSPDLFLLANPAYMESIILNFLTNAIKYHHPKRNPVIDLDALFIGRELVLKIKDNGIGIDLQRHKDALFGMYKTFHGNSDAKGIGLFITKFQVESMGGRIEVESEEDAGTTFSLFFPYTL
jgi:signal transduction histidine kinase